MGRREELFEEGRVLVHKMQGITGVVQNEIPYRIEDKMMHNAFTREFYMEFIEWDEEVNKYIDWQISENKRNEES